MSAETSNAGTAATSASAGWGRDYWWRRSNSAGSRGTSKSRYSSENWNLLLRITSKLQDGERRRKVGYTGVAPFNGIPGDPLAGDPALEWDQIKTAEDLHKTVLSLRRDTSIASVIEKEVLARDRKALMLVGTLHLLHGAGATA